MKKVWRGLVLGGVAIEVCAALAAPGCSSAPAKKKVPIPYADAGASGDSPSAAGAPGAGDSGAGGNGATSGEAGSPTEGGAAGAAGAPETGGTAGSGGAALTGCDLGDPCCAGNLCESSLACLGAACSCVADLSDSYMLRTDGIAFTTTAHEQAQSVIKNGDNPSLVLRGIKQISGTNYHGCAVLDSGNVRCWGMVDANTVNSLGQLGNGTIGGTYPTLSATLVKVDANTNLSNVVAINGDSMDYFGAETTCAVTSDGSVYCWGDYSTGIIPGASAPVPFATQIQTGATGPALTGATQVAIGYAHACALVSGKVRCWGQEVTPTAPYPTTDITLPGNVLKIVAGYGVTYALTDNDGGAVYAWGNNNGGKLADGDPNVSEEYNSDTPIRARISANAFLNDVTDIVASYNGACVVRTDHTLLCWGEGLYYATPMAVGGVLKTADNVAISDAVKVSTPGDSDTPRYVTTSGDEYSEGIKITPNCTIQE